MKPVTLSEHAQLQARERGTNHDEVVLAIERGARKPVRHGRWLYEYNLAYNALWHGRMYAIKQVAPVVVETPGEYVVVTVFTFYF